MKKRSTWLVFLAALLCLTMLLVSCDTADNTDGTVETTDTSDTTDTEDTTPTESEEKTPTPESVDHAALLKKWTNYLSYKADENDDGYYNDVVQIVAPDEDREDFYNTNGPLWYSYDESYDDENDPDSGYYSLYKVVNLVTGEVLFDEMSTWKNGTYTEEDMHIDYKVDIYFTNGGDVFRVVKTTEAFDILEDAYVTTYEVTFYTASGEVLDTFETDDSTEIYQPRAEDVSGGDSYVYIQDSFYIFREGEIIATFNALDARGIPEFDRQYADMYYAFEDASIRIFDKDYNELIAYNIDQNGMYYGAWNTVREEILSNGSVLLQFEKMSDIEFPGAIYVKPNDCYFAQKYVLIDPVKGTATELDLDFCVYELVTPATEHTATAVKEGYQLASAIKIDENGALATDMTFLVLDNEMKVVEELPAILKNQNGLIGAFDGANFYVNTDVSIDNETIEAYLITLDGKLSLWSVVNYYSNDYYFDNVNGGFVYRGILYNDLKQELVDLRPYRAYNKHYVVYENGTIGLFDYEENTLQLLNIVDGKAVYSDLIDSTDIDWVMNESFIKITVYNDSLMKNQTVIYNRYGKELLRGDYIDYGTVEACDYFEKVVYNEEYDAQYSYYIVK